MKHALIVGASGLIGKALLELLLKGDDYSKVIAIGRRRVDVAHPKLESRIIDFDNIAKEMIAMTLNNLSNVKSSKSYLEDIKSDIKFN